MDPSQFNAAVNEAAERAYLWYGPENGRRAFDEARRFMRLNEDQRNVFSGAQSNSFGRTPPYTGTQQFMDDQMRRLEREDRAARPWWSITPGIRAPEQFGPGTAAPDTSDYAPPAAQQGSRTYPEPSGNDINLLGQHRNNARALQRFDHHYGPGAAARALRIFDQPRQRQPRASDPLP